MQFAAAGDLESLGSLRFLHPQGYVRIEFPEQPVAQVTAGDIFAFLSRQGRIIDDKVHGDGGFRNLLERNGLRFIGGAEGIADVNVGDTGDCHDGADAGFLDFYFIQTVILVEFADLDFLLFVRFVMVDNDHFLIDFDGTVVYLTHTDTAHILVVVDGADQHLGACIGVTLGCRDMLDDGVKERRHIAAFYGKLCGGCTGFG